MYITWFCVLDMNHYPIYANRSLIVYNLIKQIMVCYGTKEHFHAIGAQNASLICIPLFMFWHVIKTIIAIFTSLPPLIIDKLCFTTLTEILGPLHCINFWQVFKKERHQLQRSLFWNSRSSGLSQICQKYWTKRPNWECHTQLIHRKTYSLEIHIYQTKTRAGYSMSYVSFHSFMQVYFLCNCLYPNSMNGSSWISFIMWCVFKSNIAIYIEM